jgi:hypothetical protein
MTMETYEAKNGFLGMGSYVILRIVGLIGGKEYLEWHIENELELEVCDEGRKFYSSYPCPMWLVPRNIVLIMGSCNETFSWKNHWLFKEIMQGVEYFDLNITSYTLLINIRRERLAFEESTRR